MGDDGQMLPEESLYCFLNSDRPCGADCMAFKTVGQNNERLDSAQQHCVLLSSVERGGNGLNVLAAIAGVWIKDQKIRDADARRTAGAPPPPNPLGGHK